MRMKVNIQVRHLETDDRRWVRVGDIVNCDGTQYKVIGLKGNRITLEVHATKKQITERDKANKSRRWRKPKQSRPWD